MQKVKSKHKTYKTNKPNNKPVHGDVSIDERMGDAIKTIMGFIRGEYNENNNISNGIAIELCDMCVYLYPEATKQLIKTTLQSPIKDIRFRAQYMQDRLKDKMIETVCGVPPVEACINCCYCIANRCTNKNTKGKDREVNMWHHCQNHKRG